MKYASLLKQLGILFSPKFGNTDVSVNFNHPPEKNFLGGEVPGEELPPIVGGLHNGGLLKDAGQVLGRVPAVCLRRFY
jgi:hypothetical protein